MAFSWSKVGNEAQTKTRFGAVSIYEDDGAYLWRIAQPDKGILVQSDSDQIDIERFDHMQGEMFDQLD